MKTIGVIGLGSIGLRHAKNLLAMGHKVYGLDLDVQKEIEFVKAGGAEIPVPFDIASDCEAVVVASPSTDHFLHLAEAIKDGLPVLVEKPIATEFPEALSHVLKAARAPVMVGNNLRFHSCVKKAKEWLDTGLIGQPLWANFTLAQYNDKYTEDVVLNWGSHELDLARYLLGPCWVKAAVGTRDIADIILRHDSGCRATVHLDYVTKPERRAFLIAGTEGRMHVDLVERFAWIDAADNNHSDFSGEDSFDQNYIEEMQAFIARIDGREGLGATGEDGLAVLELCLEAKRLAGIT